MYTNEGAVAAARTLTPFAPATSAAFLGHDVAVSLDASVKVLESWCDTVESCLGLREASDRVK